MCPFVSSVRIMDSFSRKILPLLSSTERYGNYDEYVAGSLKDAGIDVWITERISSTFIKQ